jgi:hypothetical protein
MAITRVNLVAKRSDHEASRWVHVNMDLKLDVRFNLNDED